jgi:hypothetical protein
MLRRTALASLMVLALGAGRAEAVSVRDIIELTKAGLSDSVLLALIEVDRTVYPIDTATMKQLREANVSDAVIVAMIHSGRTSPAVEQPAAPAAPDPRPEPPVVVIDHHDPAPAPVAYPVAVPVYVPVETRGYDGRRAGDRVTATIATDQGIVRARVPVPANCVAAKPVYWGYGGQLRPGSWEPAPTVVCR